MFFTYNSSRRIARRRSLEYACPNRRGRAVRSRARNSRGLFDRNKPSPELLRDDGGSATPRERVENEIARVRRSENEFGDKFFGFLGGVSGVFGHRPVRNGDIAPEIRRTCIAELDAVRFFPVLGGAVFAVRSDYFSADFHRVPIESIIVRNGAEPHVLERIFPVFQRTSALSRSHVIRERTSKYSQSTGAIAIPDR